MATLTDLNRIEGHRLSLQLVSREDAAYIYGLRTNPDYNEHLSDVTGTAEDQQRWIDRYKEREAKGLEYYYLIQRRDGVPCGVVRLYEIGPDQFTWGSWILDHNKPAKAALESAVLSFGVGFEALGLGQARLEARLSNTHAIAFYRRFGIEEIGRDDENVHFAYSRDRFRIDLPAHRRAIEAPA